MRTAIQRLSGREVGNGRKLPTGLQTKIGGCLKSADLGATDYKRNICTYQAESIENYKVNKIIEVLNLNWAGRQKSIF